MSTLKEKIGEDCYSLIEKEVNKEVSLAVQFEITDKYGQDRYYQARPIPGLLLEEFEEFQTKGFDFSPVDVFGIMFDAKLQRACTSEDEHIKRRGGSSLFDEPAFQFLWTERNKPLEEVISKHFSYLTSSSTERILASEITDFNDDVSVGDAESFFEQLFIKIGLPFGLQIDPVKEGIDKKRLPRTGRFTFKTSGTRSYAHFYAQAYLRTFLNILRIAGFLHRGQIDFGMWDIVMMAPIRPYFLNTNEVGGILSWEEDKKKPWEKIPDGRLFISFGYRGITTLFLDSRTFPGIEKVFLDNSLILDRMSNPWTKTCTMDIATSLDILSTATQTPDLGAKILQIYCCLEHLFVPKNIQKDNIKYIIGAINVLRPDLLPWFDNLYKLRCDYAHKGYVQRDEKTLGLVFESMSNTLALLTAKLKQD